MHLGPVAWDARGGYGRCGGRSEGEKETDRQTRYLDGLVSALFEYSCLCAALANQLGWVSKYLIDVKGAIGASASFGERHWN